MTPVPSEPDLTSVGPAVVTGAGGFIGRRLVTRLRTTGVETHAWIRSDVDLADAHQVRQAMRRDQPRTVFHLASGAVSPERQQEDCIGLELAMTAHLIAGMPAGAMLVQAGSMGEYGRSGRLQESDAVAPHSLYGRAKLAATQHALEHGPAAGLIVCVARIFGAYGPGEAPARLVPNLIRALGAGEAVPLSDGRQRRDFIHVDDVCLGLLRLAAAQHGAAPRLVNLGTGQALSVRSICERIADLLGADRGLLAFGAVERRATDEEVLEADTTRLKALIGEVPPQRFLHSDDRELAALLGL